MKQPEPLTAGDEIRIISTARKISEKELQPAIEAFESWGLKISLGKNLFAQDNQFAGTKEQRAADLQAALDDEQVKAIVFARGGYGTVQVIDLINFSKFQKNPKWLCGYSDVTVLHNHINQNIGIETIHSAMPIDIFLNNNKGAKESLRKVLFGEKYEIVFEMERRSKCSEPSISAPIVGGNLSIIYSLTGTKSQINCEGKFLFIEDLDEYLYHIDRMMANLKRAGIFKGCKGVLVGGMNDMNDNTIPYGKTAKEIILDNLEEFDFPVIFGVPAGHIKQNMALIMNRKVEFSIDNNSAKLNFNGRA